MADEEIGMLKLHFFVLFQRRSRVLRKLVSQYNTTSRLSIQYIFYDLLLYTCKYKQSFSNFARYYQIKHSDQVSSVVIVLAYVCWPRSTRVIFYTWYKGVDVWLIAVPDIQLQINKKSKHRNSIACITKHLVWELPCFRVFVRTSDSNNDKIKSKLTFID